MYNQLSVEDFNRWQEKKWILYACNRTITDKTLRFWVRPGAEIYRVTVGPAADDKIVYSGQNLGFAIACWNELVTSNL